MVYSEKVNVIRHPAPGRAVWLLRLLLEFSVTWRVAGLVVGHSPQVHVASHSPGGKAKGKKKARQQHTGGPVKGWFTDGQGFN